MRGVARIPGMLVVLAVVAMAGPAGASAHAAPPQAYLDQGWSAEIRQRFYYTPQGSRLMPRAWFMALESGAGDGLFADSANLARYGFVAGGENRDLNPDGLPVGFAIDPVEIPGRGRYIGLTCSACHTADVTVGGQVLRIDGAPAHLDFDSFHGDLAAAVHRTWVDADAFARFAARVLDDPSPEAVAALGEQFGDFQTTMTGDALIRRPSVDGGFGRADALNQIINALTATGPGEPRNLRPVRAPVSYPSIWLTPRFEYLEWNPFAASPIGRNGGQVLGVFGWTTLAGDAEDIFASSILVRELHALEGYVAGLRPPPWDEDLFGVIDRDLAAAGETLYLEHCAACHNAPPWRETDPADNLYGKTFIEIGRVDYREIGTDPAYVESLSQRFVRTTVATAPLFGGRAIVPATVYFPLVAATVINRAMDALGLDGAERAAVIGYRLRPPENPGDPPRPYLPRSWTDLKAAPLTAVWVTGPYLHNGSVATVDELLSPVSGRRAVFWTGGRELDLDGLGFMSDEAPGLFRFDTSLPGNRNTGHLYPEEGLGPDERRAIVEYLKTI